MVMAMTANSTTTITTADDIGALLDELAHAFSDIPGRMPNDAQIARVLLSYTATCIHGAHPSQFLLDTLEAYGADIGEVQRIARALAGTALRLGAWLGRANP